MPIQSRILGYGAGSGSEGLATWMSEKGAGERRMGTLTSSLHGEDLYDRLS
jgi:hypothetical protein